MNHARNIAWWLAFTTVGICMQAFIPGVDVLVVGLIILLVERDYKNMLWLLPLFILLQEGMGTRIFGASIACYAITMALFRMLHWLFAIKNLLLIFLLAACMGVAYYGVAWLMAPLQALNFPAKETMDKSLFQAILTPFFWQLCIMTRTGGTHDEET